MARSTELAGDARSGKLAEHVLIEIAFKIALFQRQLGDALYTVAAGTFRGTLALLRAEQGRFTEARALLATGDSQLRGALASQLAILLCKQAMVERLAGEPAAAAAALAEAEAIAVELSVGPDSKLARSIAKARIPPSDRTPR